jgi:5-methylcytosine-specific restriction endonuclease McrA
MRARNLKPGLFKNEQLGTADPLYTLIFEGLWTLADREGRLEDRPLRIHAEINPYRDAKGTATAVDWLVEKRFVIRYEVEGVPYLQILTFHKHQNPHQRESPSEIPPPPGGVDRYLHDPVTAEQRTRILTRDGACRRCGSTKNLEVDHIVPLAKRGTSEDENLQALCGPCNRQKGAKHSLGSDKAQPRLDLGTAKAMSSPADSLFSDSGFRTPDSPFIDSGFRIPDSESEAFKKRQAEENRQRVQALVIDVARRWA